MEEGTQMDLMDELDQLINEGDERRISQAKARLERDGYRMVTMHELKTVLPLGTVIIIEQPRWRDNRMVMHYYRTVLGEHMTVGGPVRHLETAVNDEWNDLPPWLTGSRQVWTYPNSTHVHWTKGEMEEDEEE